MELHQLRYFCAVVRAGSFTRAAEQMGITQPSLSQQIHALEKSIGIPLFERLGRSIRLTAYGEALHQPALEILQQVAAAECRIANLQHGVRGKLRVGVIPTVMPFLIAPRTGEFLERFPEVDLRLIEDTTAQLIEQLQSGDLDIAIATLPVRNPDIVCSELFREPLLLAVPRDHPLAGKRTVRLQDIQNDRLLLLKEGHCLRDDVLLACRRAKTEFHSVFESNQLATIFQLVGSGFGLTLVPAMTAAHAGGCALLPLEGGSYRRIGYLRAKRHVVSRPTREFASWLRSLKQNSSTQEGPKIRRGVQAQATAASARKQ